MRWELTSFLTGHPVENKPVAGDQFLFGGISHGGVPGSPGFSLNGIQSPEQWQLGPNRAC